MKESSNLDFTDFGKIIWRYRRAFVWTGLVSGILGVILSLLLPVYFQSTATLYPAAITYVESTDLIYRRGNITEFGDTEQAEQILEMFSSADFRDKVIKQQGLYEHYRIDPEQPGSLAKISQQYQKRITAERSRYNAVKISVEDKDPEKAASIVNAIIRELDVFRNEVIRKRITSHVRSLKKSRDSLIGEFSFWSDSLQVLQEKGVTSKEERAGLMESLGNVRGNTTEIQKRIDANLRYGSRYDIAEREVEFIQSQINVTDKILLQWETNSAEGISQQFVFEEGRVPDKKHAPKRLFVVLGVTGFTLFLLFCYLYLRENWPVVVERLES